METYNLVSLGGLFALLGIAWLLSPNKKAVNGRVVFWGLVLQTVFAVLIFVVPAGARLFLFVNELVIRILESASAGTRFIFGRLALPPGVTDENGVESLGYFFAFQGVPTIVFFSALMGLLYFFRIMPWVIRGFAAVFSRLMGVSGAESLCAASEIFLGIESSFAIRPYIERMTESELTTVLTAGMATVASNVLAVYVIMLRPVFPTIAGHLVSASLLAAPSALIMSKLLMPETGKPETLGLRVTPDLPRENNVIEAVINAANSGVRLIIGICALLLAFLGLVALTDLVLKGAGGWINGLAGIRFDWSLKGLLGMVFYPFTLLIGVPVQDAAAVARLIGERSVVTEVTAYQDLAVLMQRGVLIHPRSFVICTYALCGFAHVASLAVFVGGISALAPSRRGDLARLGPRALLAATLACLMTGALAGAFFNQGMVSFRP
jgi:concentrative nucleoside transporter, CNT family